MHCPECTPHKAGEEKVCPACGGWLFGVEVVVSRLMPENEAKKLAAKILRNYANQLEANL
jgi:hypothetical protein